MRQDAKLEPQAARAPDDLLEVAERLFAERGVEAIAMTQIVALAGHRNRSALHYHFGSRDGVLTAVLNRRLAPINAQRERELDQLPPMAATSDVLAASMRPLVDAIVSEAWGADYVAVLAQVMHHPQLLGREAVDQALLTGARRTRRLLTAVLPDLPADVIARRLAWLNETVVSVLTRWVRDTPAPARTQITAEALLAELVAFGAAGLAAPLPLPSKPEPLR
jgi:AcrR family transcriptional regulator